MSQRVNIQYSVEVDTLQETVDYLYNKVIKRVDRLNQNMVETSSFLDIALIEEIDEARLELAQIDTQLADIDRIVKGYIKFKTSEEEDEENQIPNTAEPNRDSFNEQGIDNNTEASQA
jgi:molybdopterin converting factor small subunit